MADESEIPSPLESVSAGERATTAFELLGNETRLAILVALWERYDPFDEDDAVRFSELRDRVGTADSGQFNYHLDRLEGHFVDATDDGYRLTRAGRRFVQSVVAGAGIESPSLEPTPVDVSCTLCGGAVEVMYENGYVEVLCTECDGLWAGDGDGQRGRLAQFTLDPAGLADRTPAEIYAAGWVYGFQHLYSMIEGVCPTCSGRVDRELDVCDDHGDDGRCANCGRRARTIARMRCTVCKDSSKTTIGAVAKYHPAIVGFCYEHGLELQHGIDDLAHIRERLERAESEVEYLSTDPPRVRVTTHIDGASRWVELDEHLAVVDVEP